MKFLMIIKTRVFFNLLHVVRKMLTTVIKNWAKFQKDIQESASMGSASSVDVIHMVH